MIRYNLIIDEGKEPGLRIMTSSAYQERTIDNPGLIHVNEGDFYSDVPVENLAKVINGALGAQEFLGKPLNKDIVICDTSSFNPALVREKKDYLIMEPEGIRLYSTNLHVPEATSDTNRTYELISLSFIEKLVTDEKKGSLQIELETFSKKLKSLKK